jgi:TfoX N-terminal domain
MVKRVDPVRRAGGARPEFRKSPPALVQRFREQMARHAEVEVRVVFGCPCAFIRGNMVSGLFGEEWFVRLPAEDRPGLLRLKGAHLFEPMPGRALREQIVLPASILRSTAKVQAYVEKAVAHGLSLPPKAAKARRSSGAKPRKR